MRTPPSTSGTPSSSACASTPMPTRSSGTERLLPALSRVEHAHGLDAALARARDGELDVAADVVGKVRVRRERDGQPGREQLRLRVQPADLLAQPRRRDLDGGVAVAERV